MLSAPAISDNLATRIVAILLGAFIVLTLLLSAVLLWPRPGETGAGLFRLPLPEETAAIASALEAASPQARPYVVKALNTSVVSVHMADDFPPVPPGLARSQPLETLFRTYGDLLQDRPFRVDVRRGRIPVLGWLRGGLTPTPVQMSIRLRNGLVVVIEHRPGALVRDYIARAAEFSGIAGLTILAALTLAVRQTVRPVNRLATAVRGFSLDQDAPDLPANGPRELRELSGAFNEMQHRIRALARERTRVLGAVAHDMRTYLTRLRLRIEFIGEDDQRLRAQRDVEEMAQLLEDILFFSERSAKAETAALEPIDLTQEVIEFVAVRRDSGEAVSGPAADAPPAIVPGQRLALRRILANLTDNALRYGEAAQLSLKRSGDTIALHVDDDGPGVPSEALACILEPFVRLESSRARTTGGAGLGLAIVKGLAGVCGAELRLGNRPEGGFRASLIWRAVD